MASTASAPSGGASGGASTPSTARRQARLTGRIEIVDDDPLSWLGREDLGQNRTDGAFVAQRRRVAAVSQDDRQYEWPFGAAPLQRALQVDRVAKQLGLQVRVEPALVFDEQQKVVLGALGVQGRRERGVREMRPHANAGEAFANGGQPGPVDCVAEAGGDDRPQPRRRVERMAEREPEQRVVRRLHRPSSSQCRRGGTNRRISPRRGRVPLRRASRRTDALQVMARRLPRFVLVCVPVVACSAPPRAPRLDDVPAASSQALVVNAVAAGTSRATVEAWERDGDGWRRVLPPMDAVVGRSGVVATDTKREGDGGTPAGVHRLGTAFGVADHVTTRLPYRRATGDDWWIDDPASPSYNRWVVGKPAVSAEAMRREDGQYELGAVIEWNTDPVVPGRGSAIFLHVWRAPDRPTAGCVALSRENVAALLAWLDRDREPVIVIRAP